MHLLRAEAVVTPEFFDKGKIIFSPHKTKVYKTKSRWRNIVIILLFIMILKPVACLTGNNLNVVKIYRDKLYFYLLS